MKQIQARQDETLKLIKEIILKTAKKHNIEIDKIILFGSRARGDYREDSDWDILIVTEEKLDTRRKITFWYEIYRRIDLPVDIIVVSENTLKKFGKDTGFIYKYALEEGITI